MTAFSWRHFEATLAQSPRLLCSSLRSWLTSGSRSEEYSTQLLPNPLALSIHSVFKGISLGEFSFTFTNAVV